MRLAYDPGEFYVQDVKIVWEKNKLPQKTFKKENGIWITDLFLPEGQYYYRFLLDNKISINDPTANLYLPDEKEILWSVLMVSADGERLYNNQQYFVHIEKYNVMNNICEGNLFLHNKKDFNTSVDPMIAMRFEFTQITGLHTVTVIWYNPFGDILDVSENTLFNTGKEDDPVIIWFCLDLQNRSIHYPDGVWTAKLLIDGEYILEDKFRLKTTSAFAGTYSFDFNV